MLRCLTSPFPSIHSGFYEVINVALGAFWSSRRLSEVLVATCQLDVGLASGATSSVVLRFLQGGSKYCSAAPVLQPACCFRKCYGTLGCFHARLPLGHGTVFALVLVSAQQVR